MKEENENAPKLSIPERLAIERQLLREEKFIVYALKCIKEERHALQREWGDLNSALKELMLMDKKNKNQEAASTSMDYSVSGAPSTSADSLINDDIGSSFDNEASSQVELNLTVPTHTHNFYDPLPVEEFEDIEEDLQVDMGMLMNE